jgi:hypothetical protein
MPRSWTDQVLLERQYACYGDRRDLESKEKKNVLVLACQGECDGGRRDDTSEQGQ